MMNEAAEHEKILASESRTGDCEKSLNVPRSLDESHCSEGSKPDGLGMLGRLTRIGNPHHIFQMPFVEIVCPSYFVDHGAADNHASGQECIRLDQPNLLSKFDHPVWRVPDTKVI